MGTYGGSFCSQYQLNIPELTRIGTNFTRLRAHEKCWQHTRWPECYYVIGTAQQADQTHFYVNCIGFIALLSVRLEAVIASTEKVASSGDNLLLWHPHSFVHNNLSHPKNGSQLGR